MNATSVRSISIFLVLLLAAGAILILRTLETGNDAASADTEKDTKPTPANQTPVFESTSEAPPPPYLFRFVEADGYVSLPRWDDRQLSQEEKDANPWINPRWAPFNRCMVAAGLGLPDKSTLLQHDIDAIIASVNESGPFLRRNEAGGLEVIESEVLAAYAACFEATLAVLPDDLADILEPGDPTGENPSD